VYQLDMAGTGRDLLRRTFRAPVWWGRGNMRKLPASTAGFRTEIWTQGLRNRSLDVISFADHRRSHVMTWQWRKNVNRTYLILLFMLWNFTFWNCGNAEDFHAYAGSVN